MAIITLTTDFGTKDHFVGAIKGTLLSQLPDTQLVDISHQVSPFNIQECAYILKNSYSAFPEGSIHIVGVDAEPTPENQHLAVWHRGHYFLLANNGILGLIMGDETPDKVVAINLPDTGKHAFPVLEVFVQVACHIHRGGTLEVIGRTFSELKQLREFNPRITENGNSIIGSVIYIDNYGNVVTNIERQLFEAYRAGRSYELLVRNKRINQIQHRYSDIINFDLEKHQRKGPGDLLAIFNSSGHVELAIYKSDQNTVGGAASLLGLDYRDTVTLNFL